MESKQEKVQKAMTSLAAHTFTTVAVDACIKENETNDSYDRHQNNKKRGAMGSRLYLAFPAWAHIPIRWTLV